MNVGQALFFITYNLLRPSKSKLRHETLQAWIRQHSNRDQYGRGSMGGRLNLGASKAFIEVTRSPVGGGRKWNVRASAFLDARQGHAATKEWPNVTLDRGLEKFFDAKNRVNIPF